MNRRLPIVLLALMCATAFGSESAAETPTEAGAQSQWRVTPGEEYEQAIAKADASRAEAERALEKAHGQFQIAVEQRKQHAIKNRELSEERRAEVAAMREELVQAQRQLRKSSREISRMSRELAREGPAPEALQLAFSSVDRPLLGVILGDTTDVGIKVLGVTPDGPAERAGVAAGDVIVALGGRVLASVDEDGDINAGLKVTLKDLRANEPVIVSVERSSETLDLTVVPEVREPLTWQSVSRFPSIPSAPALAGDTIFLERIVVPEIDTEGLTEQIERMRIKIDRHRAEIDSAVVAPSADGRRYEFQLGDMSEMGEFALHETNAWFGMPLASGLRLAKINPDLGEYFKTDRGVLVLQAKEDNGLLLKSGDVILSVRGIDVSSPADFMRALRGFEPGDESAIDIKRKRKSKTLKPVIEEAQARLFAPRDHELHTITITTDPD